MSVSKHTEFDAEIEAHLELLTQRYVSQGMLDLKRLFWNCRAFTHGMRRGASPYQLLGLKLPTDNWWELLQMDPDV